MIGGFLVKKCFPVMTTHMNSFVKNQLIPITWYSQISVTIVSNSNIPYVDSSETDTLMGYYEVQLFLELNTVI